MSQTWASAPGVTDLQAVFGELSGSSGSLTFSRVVKYRKLGEKSDLSSSPRLNTAGRTGLN